MKLLNSLTFFKKKQSFNQMNRRLESRHLARFSAVITLPNKDSDKEIIATVLNFSPSGLAILASKEIQPNEVFEIQLAFNSERTIQVQFKATNCKKVETGYIIGSQILTPCPQYQALFTKITQPRHSVVSDCW